MVVLETMDISPEGNIARYVITVTQTTIKTVDSNGYPYYYDRNSGKLKLSAQSSRIMNDVALGRLTWNGGLRPYLNTDNTINPQWKRADGSSIDIKAIKGLKIKKMKFNL